MCINCLYRTFIAFQKEKKVQVMWLLFTLFGAFH